ncbi:hypothetical protein SDC9_155061 [bioreactor metagenome]|uniref:Uncharacterized protein n=1 Tax=bioreactor metagenome TaxID=1076179 RepID=A0A645F2Z6_9ZZZZ
MNGSLVTPPAKRKIKTGLRPFSHCAKSCLISNNTHADSNRDFISALNLSDFIQYFKLVLEQLIKGLPRKDGDIHILSVLLNKAVKLIHPSC